MALELSTTRVKNSRILINSGLDDFPIQEMLDQIHSNRCLVIADENALHSHPWFVSLLKKKFSDTIVAKVKSGESSKSLSEWSRLVDLALTNKLRRGTPIFAFGGGVTGDLAGFVASTVLRGLPLIQIPTTLLAMVDSSIGGKTGINHATGKNLIGTFYQPDFVFADMRFLSTLPVKEWNCGLGEIIKYACISNPKLFEELKYFRPGCSTEKMASIIQVCAQIKAEIVMSDELETGIRAFLNYGHTFAHALEAHTRYKVFAHGEAVYAGLVAATWLSNQFSDNQIDTDRILWFRDTFNLKTAEYIKDISKLITSMYSDKKIRRSMLRLVLLNDWGTPYLREFDNTDILHDAWGYSLEKVHVH
jgi:3-dehydroquinate synthase